MADSTVKIQLGDIQQSATCGICLQLLNDPRALTCSHTFCLDCLKNFQTSAVKKECPMCRVLTVPSSANLDQLPVNRLAVDMVRLVHTYDPATREESPTDWSDTNRRPNPVAISDSPFSEDLFSLMQTVTIREPSYDDSFHPDVGYQQLQSRHSGVTCDRCYCSPIIGNRFKCGICNDYDLCEECEALPRDDVHDPEHIFIKLKKPRACRPGCRRVLHEDSTILGSSQDPSQDRHAIHHGINTTNTLFRCDNCPMNPIVGTRYKCGLCPDYDLCGNCERLSETVHDPTHVFLVLRHPVGFLTTIPQLQFNFYKKEARHDFTACDNCDREPIMGNRYKCGICDDYDLCENCEALPRAEIHDPGHVFIKLKKPRTTRPAHRRVLQKESTALGNTQDFGNNRHVMSRMNQADILFRCDKCTASPIIGTRYKCGNCPDFDLCETCEKNSQHFHNPRHIFLVLRHAVGVAPQTPQLKYNFYR